MSNICIIDQFVIKEKTTRHAVWYYLFFHVDKTNEKNQEKKNAQDNLLIRINMLSEK